MLSLHFCDSQHVFLFMPCIEHDFCGAHWLPEEEEEETDHKL